MLEPLELKEGTGLSVVPTPAMAGSASRMNLAKDSTRSPPPPLSSESGIHKLFFTDLPVAHKGSAEKNVRINLIL